MEHENHKIQRIYFIWFFSKNPQKTNFEAIEEFTKKFNGSQLLCSKELSIIKSKKNCWFRIFYYD